MSKCAKCGIGDRAYQQCQVECPVEAIRILGRDGDEPLVEADLCKRCSARAISYIAQSVAAFWNDDIGFFTSQDFDRLLARMIGEAVDERVRNATQPEKA